MAQGHGNFIWYELMTTDPLAAEAFYRAVVGWEMADAGQPGMRYTVLSAGKRGVGGLMALPAEACEAGAKPGWTGYIGVADTDAVAKQIVESGGSIHRGPDDIPDVGRFAVVADPGGAVFMLLTPLPREVRPEPLELMASGHVGWHAALCRQRPGGRVRVLFRPLRLGDHRHARHGRDGQIPHLRGGRRAVRRHDGQAGQRAGVCLDLLRQCRGNRCGREPNQGQQWAGADGPCTRFQAGAGSSRRTTRRAPASRWYRRPAERGVLPSNREVPAGGETSATSRWPKVVRRAQVGGADGALRTVSVGACREAHCSRKKKPHSA